MEDNNTNEIWVDIPGYNGIYQVSNIGRVKTNRSGVRILSQYESMGYYSVDLYFNKKRKKIKVHKLVAMAFLGHTPCGHKSVIDHKNNNLKNLQVVTSRYNSSKTKKDGSTSKYNGVSFDKERNKWRASIYINGRRLNLGRYDCELKAHIAYSDKLKSIL